MVFLWLTNIFEDPIEIPLENLHEIRLKPGGRPSCTAPTRPETPGSGGLSGGALVWLDGVIGYINDAVYRYI